MKKHIMDMRVTDCQKMADGAYALIKLSPCHGNLPEILPGQFAQIEVPDSKNTFLRRPISVNFVDYESNELWLLVRKAGEGTAHLIASVPGDIYNVILPLGHGFSYPTSSGKTLLVGGGVGVAPLLFFGKELKKKGMDFEFVLGARSDKDLLMLSEFEKYGPVNISTEDGSLGEQGFVTQHSCLGQEISRIACCGPTPMMKAVAKIASARGIACEVSLENMMACGIGACLCCVEDTTEGNVCVCTNGPVFNIKQLKWEL